MAGVIIGKSDEFKGYGFFSRDKTIVMTQHVRNVETLKRNRTLS